MPARWAVRREGAMLSSQSPIPTSQGAVVPWEQQGALWWIWILCKDPVTYALVTEALADEVRHEEFLENLLARKRPGA